jgi:nicotinate-nucleotide pyrophosphorylase (carboxylating)
VTPRALLDRIIELALWEDLSGGDLTSEATVAPDSFARATVVAKGELVVSGGEVFARCFHAVDAGSRVERLLPDGSFASAGTELFRVEGRARSLLMAERTALNFLQRLSGTASLTRAFVEQAGGRARIVDTRKTTPGLRLLEKQAVRHGGGHNHRFDLASAVMIKDNHIQASGGIRTAIERARQNAPHTTRIEVEVSNQEELEQALSAGADIIMLDNFTDEDLKHAVQRAKGRALVEVSGNVTLDRLPVLCQLGVDVISIGALTHSAPASDISLRLSLLGADGESLS